VAHNIKYGTETLAKLNKGNKNPFIFVHDERISKNNLCISMLIFNIQIFHNMLINQKLSYCACNWWMPITQY